MWVTPAFIGTGIGKELFLDAMERAANLNLAGFQLTADPNAAGFYKRMGAEQIGEVGSEIEGQPRILPRMKIDI
jgi:GNAT superfamily N-acetyltransferase